MFNRKYILKIILCIVIIFGIFIGGYITGYLDTNRRWTNASIAEKKVVRYFFGEIDKHFGSINQYDDYEIIDWITYKDATCYIINDNGIKTIRYYRYKYD
jgi:hypothetical protein